MQLGVNNWSRPMLAQEGKAQDLERGIAAPVQGLKHKLVFQLT